MSTLLQVLGIALIIAGIAAWSGAAAAIFAGIAIVIVVEVRG